MENLLANEDIARLSVFLGGLVIMAAWEVASPHRRHEIPRLIRWTNNIGLVILDTFVLRLVFPVLAVGFAQIVALNGWGVLPLLGLPQWAMIVVSVLLLDVAIYGQHIVFHKVPLLWRLHRTHHSDPEFDVTTALRFHPIEIAISMAIKMTVIAALGVPAVAVLLFELLLNGGAMFSHSNIRIPERLDRILRLVIVTPDMHRIHHSEIRAETDSNYGFSFSFWDRLFGTYLRDSIMGRSGIVIGIGLFKSIRDQWIDRLLVQPFRSRP